MNSFRTGINVWRDDFIGGGTLGTPWALTETSASGTMVSGYLDQSETAGVYRPGVAVLGFDSTNEVQNGCYSFGDVLAFDFDSVQWFETAIKFVAQTGSLKDAATTFAIGMTGDRNAAIDSITIAALFRLAAGDTSLPVVVETDDNTTNNDDVSTGISLVDLTWKTLRIDLSNKADVKFYMGDSANSLTRVAAGTTFDMSEYHGAVQPFIQLQKTADTNTDAVHFDYVEIGYKR